VGSKFAAGECGLSLQKRKPTLIYLSMAGIPSRSANSIQIMKMAEALADAYQPFRLLTSGFLWERDHSKVSLANWYGVSSLPKIRRLPEKIVGAYPFQGPRRIRLYSVLCFIYLVFNRNCILYTREEKILKWSRWLKIPIMLEVHLKPTFGECQTDKFVANNPFLLGIVAISPYLAKIYQQHLPTVKVLHLEDGVQTEVYDELPLKEELRHELNINMRRFSRLAVFTGHLYKDRGIETIIDAAKHCPDTLFLLVGGWDEDVERRREEIKERRVNNVNLCGFRPNCEMPKYQKAADVLLMPYSARLNIVDFFSSLKLFEYMASGTPIVASNIPRVSEVLSAKGGYLVPPDDSQALALEIKHVFAEYEKALARAQWARLRAKRYSWKSRAQTVLATFL
jgi:glycosyltransferase involved in cell wall biosynthesis